MSAPATRWNVEHFILTLCVVAAVTAIGWGRQRKNTEDERVQLTLQRMEVLTNLLARQKSPISAARLQSLVEKNLLAPEILKDGWGTALQYDETTNMVYSLGADGREGGSGFASDLVRTVPLPAPRVSRLGS